MEVKINREIRNYTESMFFGLSMRQFVFSILACGVAVGLYFYPASLFGFRNSFVDLYSGRCTFCHVGLYYLSWHESGTVYMGLAALGNYRTERNPF